MTPVELEEARRFLAGARVARLATADVAARPHVVPITFAYRSPFLYTALDAKPKRVPPGELVRVRNLQANPRAAVLADRFTEDWARLGFVLLLGEGELLPEAREAEAARELLREKYPQYRELGLGPVIRVRERRLVGWGELGVSPGGELLEALRERRSVRRYQELPVSRRLLEELLEAACWAPSAHNAQPWRFVILESAESRRRLAEAMGQEWRARLRRDGLPEEEIEALLRRSHERIITAPAAILFCTSLKGMDEYPDPARRRAEWAMATQSTALAAGHLLLAAGHAGLGACWLCAPLFCPEAVRQCLSLPEDWESQALVTLGYPAAVRPRGREPLASRLLVR